MTSREYSAFYAANDTEETDAPAFSLDVTDTGSVTYAPFNVAVTDSTGGVAGGIVGKRCSFNIVSGLLKCMIVGAPDATHVTLQPLPDTDRALQIATPGWLATDVITSTLDGEAHCTLSIDLTDAPPGTYNYLFLASGLYSNATASAQPVAKLVVGAEVLDPETGTAYNQCDPVIINGSLVDWYFYNCAISVTLAAGKRHEAHLIIRNGRMKNGRIAALRYDQAYATTYSDSSVTSTTTSATVATVTIPAGTSASYLIACSGGMENDTVTKDVKVYLKTSGGADPYIFEATSTSQSATETMSFGAVAIGTIRDTYTLTVNAPSGGTAKVRRPFLIAIPLDQLHVNNGWVSSHATGSADSISGATTVAWTDTQTSSSQTLDAGTYLEFASVNALKGPDGRFEMRPYWQAPSLAEPYRRGMWAPGREQQGFFMQRTTRPSGAATNKIQTNDVTGSGTVLAAQLYFTWLNLRAPLAVAESTPVSIVADVETCIVPRRWTNVSGTLYRVTLSNIERVSRVVVNGTEYTRTLDQPTASGQWFWNPDPSTDVAIDTTMSAGQDQENAAGGVAISVGSGTGFRVGRRVQVKNGTNQYHATIVSGSGTTWNVQGRNEAGDTFDGTTYAAGSTVKATLGSTLYVYLPSGDAPSDSDIRIAVYALTAVGRTPEDLTDDDMYAVPYEPRIDSVPSISQAFDAQGAELRVSSSFGELSLVNRDGAYDTLFGTRIFESCRAVLRRGWSSLSARIRDFETMFRATVGMGSMSPDSLRLRLFDRASTLERPVISQRTMVYEGTASTMREGQPLPIIYGNALRVPAWRITNVTGDVNGYNIYRIAGNTLHAVSAGYRTDTTRTTITLSTIDLTNATVRVQNTHASGGGADPPDVLYFDVNGTPDPYDTTNLYLLNPGQIALDLLNYYPKTADGTTLMSTTVATSSFTQPSGYSTAVLKVASVGSGSTAIFVGARLSVTSGSSVAHVQVTAISGTDLTVVAIQDPGDTPAGTVYAVSSTVAHLGPSSSGLAATDIDSSSFRFFDYVWRLRRQNGITKNEPLRCALYVNDAAKTVAGALDDLMRQTFGYWYANREGRIALGVPDFLASSLLTNGGFEIDGTSLWPWRAYSPASGAVTTAAAYNGTRSATVTSAGNAQAALRQQVTVPRPGVYVATAMVALSTGSSDEVSVSIVDPGDGFTETVGDPVTVSSTTWQRASVVASIGGSGSAYVSVNPNRLAEAPLPVSTGLAVHLRPNDISTVRDTTAVASWVSNTGSHTFAQATGAKQPTYRDGIVARRPTVRFDGGDVLARSGGATALGTTHTQFVVVRFSSASGEHTLMGEETGNSQLSYEFSNGGRILFRVNNGTPQAYTIGVLSADVWYLFAVKRNGTALSLYIDSTSSSFTLPENNSFQFELVGARNAAATTAPLTGDIGELMAYASTLTDAEITSTMDYLRRRFGLRNATIRVDDVELHEVAAALDENNCDVDSIEYADENYFAARATFGVNTSREDLSSAAIVTDNEARALTPYLYSEAQNTNAQAGLLDLGTTRLAAFTDAAGAAAPAAAYYGRQRQVMRLTALGLTRPPVVGSRVYVSHRRVPSTVDAYPIWTIVRVEIDPANAQAIRLDLERQLDPIYDRTTV